MPVPADLLIVLGVLAGLWITYRVIGYLRESSRPSRGDGNAYDGNLLPPGESHRPSAGPRSHHGGHIAHGGGHTGHAGHGTAGAGHH